MRAIEVIEKFARTYFDNENAVKLILDVWIVAQAWDDAHDGDDADHSLGYKAMLDIQTNPISSQIPIAHSMNKMYRSWSISNVFEAEKQELEKAWMLRAGFYDLMIDVYHGLYGDEKAVDFGVQAWCLYGETLKEYLEEMKNA